MQNMSFKYPMGRGSPGHVTCSFARAGVAELHCCPVISPCLGHGTAPPALSHRRPLPFCLRCIQSPAASSPEGGGLAPQRFQLLALGPRRGAAELKGVSPHTVRRELSANSWKILPSPAMSWRGLAQSTVAGYLNVAA